MQTLTIRVDDSYVKKEKTFLDFLEKGSTISEQERKLWEKNIQEGYKSWAVEEF